MPIRSRLAFARLAAAVASLLGCIVLVGWALDLPALRSIVPGAVEMKANTAVGLITASIALLFATHRSAVRQPWLGQLSSMLALLIGLLTLCEYVFGLSLGIDELLVRDTGAAFNQIKGRMSPYSAAAFVALGVGTLGLRRRRWHPLARIAAGVVVGIGGVSIIGYLWNASEIVTDRIVPPVAINTALGFLMLGLAILWVSTPLPSSSARRPRNRLETLILGGFAPTIVLVIVGGGMTYESGASFARAADRVVHTQQVRAELVRLAASIAGAESMQKNLVLTGELSFQTEFDRQAADARRELATLGTLIADNPAQVARHRQLAALVDTQLDAAREVGEALRRSGERTAREALLVSLRSERLQRIAALTRQMDDEESLLLTERLRRFDDRRGTTLLALLATLALLIAVFMLLFRGIQREMLARSKAEEAIQQLNADLERRIAERTRELSHQQAFLRRVIDLDRNLIFGKDRHGRFILANQAMADLYGTTVEALTNDAPGLFNSPDDEQKEFTSADVQVIDSGRELVIPEEKVTDAAGRVRWLHTVKQPTLSPDGSTPIALGFAVDITERKLAEDEIRGLNADLERRVAQRTNDLLQSNLLLEQARLDSEAASRAKSAFLANMSHEIRTPMNAVIGLTHLMLRDAKDNMHRERLGKVGHAAQHLLQVLNDILDMSKIEAGKMLLEDIEFSLDDVLANTVAMVNPQAQNKRLELVVDTDHLPNRLIGDPTRLAQILINLLSNAVKFTEHGWIRLRGQLVSEEGEQVEIRFEVQDTGPGIALDRQPALFHAFEQADPSTSRQHGGTGLGLALCRQLSQAMGGEAGVVSEPGAGSLFWFTAVLRRGNPAAERAIAVQTHGLRALLVDDLPESLSVIGERLQQLGLHVDALTSGSAALSKVAKETASGRLYDVMIIDWRMEPLDGIETLERLNRLMADGTPPAILVTAFDDATLASRARAAGYRAVLLKPITHSSLQDALADVLANRGAIEDLAPSAVEGEALVRERHAGQRVLLVEDNPVNREVAEELLTLPGLIVETAWDGAHAVEMALARSYDVILMDVQMPRMDGLEATREIRARAGYKIPIIAMTANAFSEDRATSLEAGMNDHLGKPVDPARLYAMLLRWLPMRRASAGDEPSSDFGVFAGADLRQRLEAIGAIDLPEALRHVAGQLPVLARVLRRFAMTYAEGMPVLLDVSGNGPDRNLAWRIACHSIHGALGTIGAEGLLAEVAMLSQDLREAGDVAAFAQRGEALHGEVRQLAARINEALMG